MIPTDILVGMPDQIAQTIRDELTRREMPQSRLAELAGISGPNLSNWLTGRSTVTVETALRVIDALGLQLALAPGKKPKKKRR